MPAPPGHHEIERQELSRVFGHMVGARLLAIPLIGGALAWLLVVEPSRWRRTVMAGALLLIPALFVSEWARFRRRGVTPASVSLNLGLAAVGPLVVAFATGGLSSPIIYFLVPIGLVSAIVIRPPVSFAVPVVQIGAVWAMAIVAASGAVPDFNLSVFGGGARPGGTDSLVYAHAVALTAALVAASAIGRAVRHLFETIVRRGLAAQQESLRVHAERAEELTALSGEIAHELKNPLASVKGLAGLLAQHLPDGKGAERLQVLRREVDRMQSVLDEFLNFSRPLVPLALGETDLAALCREVAALHEGIAKERGVDVTVSAAEVPARCDPRKVTQVLVNLVQNALDASPPGAVVSMEAKPLEGGGALVRVLDRGRGLDPALADAVFSPGVTTKRAGSGLGLTIARALARQHGGELSLSAREGGGTAAELTLPARASDRGGRAA